MLCCSAAFNLLVTRWPASTKALQLADHAGLLLLLLLLLLLAQSGLDLAHELDRLGKRRATASHDL